MSKGDNRRQVDNTNFQDNFDKIFGAKPVMTGSFIQTDEGLVERHPNTPDKVDAPYVPGRFEAFQSPIDGKMITDRGQLRRIHKANGTTDSRDYSNGYIERKASERLHEGQKELKKTRHQDAKNLVETILRRGK